MRPPAELRRLLQMPCRGHPCRGAGEQPATLSARNGVYVQLPPPALADLHADADRSGDRRPVNRATMTGYTGLRTVMAKALDEDTLKALLSAQAVRDVRVQRQGDAWGVSVRLGVAWHPIKSRREPVRTWASLTAVGRFFERLGVTRFEVEQ